MYHDSDDEPLSGDDAEERPSAPKRPPVGIRKTCYGRGGGDDGSGRRVGRRSGAATEHKQRRRSTAFSGFNIYPVIVVDYDLTLVDRSSRPFPGSHQFIEKLSEYNDGRNQLILYSHGSPAYIDDGLNKHFNRERKYFDEIVSDNSARENKPITHVRRVIKSLEHLIGPYVIVDDMRSNLDSDQYDVVIDVTRMTDYGENGRAVSVDYESCLCMIDQGVRAFLNTKKKR